MRKLVCTMHISMDGYLTSATGDLSWSGGTATEDVHAAITETLRKADTIVLGRGGFEEMAGYWPTASGETADLINAASKVVITSKTTDPNLWPNSRVVTGDVATEVEKLKRESGPDMLVYGGARFAQTLARLGLFDEYQLMTHPVAIGDGVALFRDLPKPVRLALVSARPFDSGTIEHVYRVA